MLSIFGSCVPKECQEFENRTWAFELPVTVSPARDTFQVGDSIAIESKFVNMVRDSVSGEIIELDDYDFFPTIIFLEIGLRMTEDPLVLNELTYSNVDYQVVTHSSGGASIGVDSYNYDGEMYDYKFRIKFGTPGLYLLAFDSRLALLPPWAANDNPDVDHECSRHRGDITAFYLTNGGNVIENNIEMFRSSNAVNASTRKDYEYRHFGYYTFVVAE